MQFLTSIRRLLRVEQLYKNLLVFLPLAFFPHEILHSYPKLLIAFIGLCASSSITYIINDWTDRKKDAEHPIKKERPLASGKIGGLGAAITIAILAAILGLAVWQLGGFFGMLILAHLILTNLYTFGLKNIPIIDIVLIAVNFMIRMMGAMKEFPDIQQLAYFIILFSIIVVFLSHKRRSDIKIMGEKKAGEHKKVLKFYRRRNAYLIRVAAYIVVILSLYQLWTLGLEWPKVLALLTALATTSTLLSLDPKLAIKPHHLVKNPIWDAVMIGTVVFFYI